MARNIEIKARIGRIEEMEARVAALADRGPVLLEQDDTFFPCPNGRLKLRVRSGSDGELIFYRRADHSGAKESFYLLAKTPKPDALREVLALAYGTAGHVRKQRTLYWCGRTRIHLDRVEGLGDFLELEVLLGEEEPPATGEAVARELMERLGIRAEELIDEAYIDLLTPRNSATDE